MKGSIEMFCSNCGKEIDDKAVICIHCGCTTNNVNDKNKNKSMLTAVLLWLFLGLIGAHRFYLGHTISAVIMLLCLLTFWLVVPAIILGIWLLIDIILLVSGKLKSADGSELA